MIDPKQFLLLAATVFAFNADAGEAFPTPHNSETDATARPPGPAEALERIQLPPGFNATLYAAEPDVRNPIAMAWDARGRMWVAENYTYAERKVRFDYTLRDRVIVLQDRDGDGRADERRVFTDQLQTLTSVEVGHGGVWVMCPPQLLFIPDQDGDAVPDGKAVVKLDGFTVADANYHNFANGLRWGPDGWLYGRCGHSCPGRLGTPGTPDEDRYPIEGGIWRYHPEREVVEVVTHGTTNPWGHDWTEQGELFFINTVNGHLWHGIAGARFKESFGADPNPLVYERLDMHADHWHFDTSASWTASRGGKADEYGGGHAHIGMMIYQADQWPEEYRNRLFTLNMHGRRTNVERLERHGSGYIGRHQDDVFLMGDPWFRGIDIRQGPEGSAYLLDWSDTGECHDHTGVHRTSGRIYRISHGKPARFKPLSDVRALNHPNVWHEQRLRSRSDLELPEIGIETRGNPTLHLRALWALHRAGRLSPDRLLGLLDSRDEHLRTWAIRLLVDHHPIDTLFGPRRNTPPAPVDADVLSRFTGLAKADPSGLVRLTLASTLQRLPLNQRVVLAAALMGHAEDAGDHNLPSIVWNGLTPLVAADPIALAGLASDCRWPTTVKWISRALSAHPPALDALLQQTTRSAPAIRNAVLQGIGDGMQGLRQVPRPAAWDQFVAAGDRGEAGELVRDLAALFGDGRALDAIRNVALDGKAETAMRQAALRTLIENRPPDLRKICESLLNERGMNVVAVKGLTLFDDAALGESIAKSYRRFAPAERPAIIEALVSRPAWVPSLLKEMAAGKIAKEDLPAFQARRIRAFGDGQLNRRLADVWGEVRESDADKRRLIGEWKQKLSSKEFAGGDLHQGRQLYQLVCASCHTLYGVGGRIGPDLTGSGRADLDYLLENIGDPGAVVSADYRMTSITLKDGRSLTGIVVTETPRTITLQQTTERTVINLAEIDRRETSALSMMPDGLLQALQPGQVRDLIAYLRHPAQVPLPE